MLCRPAEKGHRPVDSNLQLNRLPDCDWVHLVFTLPDAVAGVRKSNRWLLNDVCRLAVENLLYAA